MTTPDMTPQEPPQILPPPSFENPNNHNFLRGLTEPTSSDYGPNAGQVPTQERDKLLGKAFGDEKYKEPRPPREGAWATAKAAESAGNAGALAQAVAVDQHRRREGTPWAGQVGHVATDNVFQRFGQTASDPEATVQFAPISLQVPVSDVAVTRESLFNSRTVELPAIPDQRTVPIMPPVAPTAEDARRAVDRFAPEDTVPMRPVQPTTRAESPLGDLELQRDKALADLAESRTGSSAERALARIALARATQALADAQRHAAPTAVAPAPAVAPRQESGSSASGWFEPAKPVTSPAPTGADKYAKRKFDWFNS